MKDRVHHLKYIQKKVIQSTRKAENSKNNQVNGTESSDFPATDLAQKNSNYSKKYGSG